MELRFLPGALATCLSAATFAAPLYVPNRDGRWPGTEVPFVDSRSIQHDALAAGLDGVPGRPRTITDGVYLVAAPVPAGPAGTLADVATARAAHAAGRRAPIGGVSALARIGGTTTDIGDVSRRPACRDATLDLRALPHLDVEAVDLDRGLVTSERGELAWSVAPQILAAVTALLFAASVILAVVLMARGRRPPPPRDAR